jgi:serine/threonine-protein kinase HipA
MSRKVDIAEVTIWGTTVGSVVWDEIQELGFFEYDPRFLKAPVELAPLMMPKKKEIYSFPVLNRVSFRGLPGLLADSLPDKFGNLLINRWLKDQGRDLKNFSPIERLCYIGNRGMGAIEFKPGIHVNPDNSAELEIKELVRLANLALKSREELKTQFKKGEDLKNKNSLERIISVGTSAGGARAKAIIAWHEKTNEILSGQMKAPPGFGYWILKFDGVNRNSDKELDDPQGYGRIEYAYFLMAKEAGIDISDSRLLEENGRAHFITRRFDRLKNGEKMHMQTLCAIAHFDFNQAGAYAYEQAFQVVKQLKMQRESVALEQQYRRMVFNVIGRNQDDHTKNISFLMDRAGHWSLSPAYDITYSYNASGEWTSRHQMSVNGKRDHFTLEDLLQSATAANIKRPKAMKIVCQVSKIISRWPDFAKKAGVPDRWIQDISQHHRKLI